MYGGAIPVNAALEILQVLNVNVPVLGIMKDEHHKAKSIIYNNKEILLDKNTDLYLLLVNISQTVHDFAISFFRSQKAKGFFSSRLDGIKGVGPKKKEAILKRFINVEGMINGTIEEYKSIGINEELRSNIIDHLSKKDEEE